MKSKMVEVRDNGTRIPCLVISTEAESSKEHSFWCAQGFGGSDVILIRCEDQKAAYDPYEWQGRTMHEAHLYLQSHFNEIEDFSVVDVRVILGEASEPARTEVWGGLYEI